MIAGRHEQAEQDGRNQIRIVILRLPMGYRMVNRARLSPGDRSNR